VAAEAGFFIVSIHVNFKQYFFKEFLELSPDEKKVTKMGINTGKEQHKTVGRLMGSGLDRKNSYFVAKSHTRNEHIHPKITLCLNNKHVPNYMVNLTPADAKEISSLYGVYPTPEENSKGIKQTGVHMVLTPPAKYILVYKGE
jgi:hypothetical protein